MKIFITGGAGFIGSHLAEALVSSGNEVAIMDTYETGKESNIKSLIDAEKIQLSTESIVDYAAVEHVFKTFQPEVVVHAAASYKNPNDWPEDAATNVVGTANIAKLSEEYSVNRVIYFQTSLCYGLHPTLSPIPVDYPCNPQGTSYAITKTAAEQLLFLSKKLDVISFRLSNTYGPANLSGPIPTFYQRLTTNKPCFVMDTRRDFVYVSDLVRLVCRAVAGEGKRGVYHFSSGMDYSIRELYDNVRTALGMTPDPAVSVIQRGIDDAPTLKIDSSKTHADFKGWRTEVSLEEGIKAAVAWYRKHPVEQTYTHLKIPD